MTGELDDADLRALADKALPPDIARMKLMLAVEDERGMDAFLSRASRAGLDPLSLRRLSQMAADIRAAPDAWRIVRRTAEAIPHGDRPGESAEEAVQALAKRFDEAVKVSPEASVALYSLGEPARLERATEEIAAWLGVHSLLGAASRVLDLGCGIGRLAIALADDVASIVGCDISGAMIAEARRRSAHLPNATFVQTSGLDLGVFDASSFDTVIAVDSFPYLVQAGVAARLVEECARVLKPHGGLAIFNYAYGDGGRRRSELAEYADQAGLAVVTEGARPFRLWDAEVSLLRKAAPGRRVQGGAAAGTAPG